MKALILTAVAVALAGCAREPYSRGRLPVLKNVKPDAVRGDFARRSAEGGHALYPSTVYFPFMDLTVLERIDAEPGKGELGVQGYMPMGMLLFDVSAGRGTVTVNSAAAEFGKYKFIVEAIGRDLHSAYMDLTPGEGAGARVFQKEVLFTEKTSEGTLSYEYAYDPPVLIEKRLGNLWGTIWRVRYYDYRTGPDGKVRPYWIVVDNKRYFYRMVLRGDDLSVAGAGEAGGAEKAKSGAGEGTSERRTIR